MGARRVLIFLFAHSIVPINIANDEHVAWGIQLFGALHEGRILILKTTSPSG